MDIPGDAAPRAPLANILARYYDAQLDLRDAAAPWLVGELPWPLAQLYDVERRLRVCDQLALELRAELRAVWFELRADRLRSGEDAAAADFARAPASDFHPEQAA